MRPSRKYKEITLAHFVLWTNAFSYFRKRISLRRLPHSEWTARIFTQFHWTHSGSHCCRGTMRPENLDSRTWPEIISSRYHVRFMPGNLVPSPPLRLSRRFENAYRGPVRKYPILASLFLLSIVPPLGLSRYSESRSSNDVCHPLFLSFENSGGNSTFIFRFEK